VVHGSPALSSRRSPALSATCVDTNDGTSLALSTTIEHGMQVPGK
jgi:hypothetical protein